MRSPLVACLILIAASFVDAAEAAKSAPPERPAAGDPNQPRVQVTLISDGETWVSIKNVFVPEKFRSKKVTLAPGDYEVVGRRKAYRDVEKTLSVRSGSTASLTVICTVTVNSREP